MRKANLRFNFLMIAGVFITLMAMANPAAAGTIDHGYTGVPAAAQGTYVQNIFQLTDNFYMDWVSCWGTHPWSADGQWIVYQSKIGGFSDDNNEICKIKYDGTGYVQLTFNGYCDSHANFTPDGSKIVFQREPSNMAELWSMNADGTGQTSLTAAHGGAVGGGEELKPMISPDGTKIAFKTCDSDIWVMNIDGTSPVKVSGTLGNCGKHTWSPDSQWILFNSKVYYTTNDGSRIFKVRPDGSDLTMLSDNIDDPFCDNWAFWSPDGNWIAYHTNDNASPDTYTLSIMRPDGSNKTALVTETEDALPADWDRVCGPKGWIPDSKWIAFKKYDDDVTTLRSIFLINIDTLTTVQLTEGSEDYRLWWSPSGKQILFRERGYGSDRDGGSYDDDLLVINMTTGSVNLPPVAVDDAYTGTEDTPLTISAPGVLANDTDPEGDFLSAIEVTAPANGKVSLNTNGSFTYTPTTTDFFGTDSFTYKVSGGNDYSLTNATVTITLTAEDDPPFVANPIGDFSADEDSTTIVIDIGSVFSDVDNDDTLITKSVGGNTNTGLITPTISGNSLILTCMANQSGTADITIRGTSNGLWVDDVFTVTINPVSDAPVANNDTAYSTNEDTPLTVLAASGLLANDTSVEGNALTAVKVSNPANGTLTAFNTDGSFTYMPNANFYGTDSFTYKANDGSDSNIATVVITVQAIDDSLTVANPIGNVTVNEDSLPTIKDLTNVFNDVDNDNLAISKSVLSNNNPGLVTPVISGNTLTLSYAANQSGGAIITIRGTSAGKTEDNTFTVTVNPVDDPLWVANPIGDVTVNEDAAPSTVNLANVFSDIDSTITKAVLSNSNPGLVTYSLSGDTLTLSYNANQSGTAKIRVRGIADGKTADNTFTVIVNAVDDAPVVANPITDIIAEEDAAPRNISLDNLFSDVDNDSASIAKSVLSNSNQNLVWTAISGNILTIGFNANQNGTADIKIRGTSNGKTVDDTFTVTVNAVNDAPYISDIPDQSTDDSVGVGPISFTIGDPDKAASELMLSAVSSNTGLVPGGNIVFGGLGENRTVTITPTQNMAGTATITVTVSDGSKSASDTFTLTVTT